MPYTVFSVEIPYPLIWDRSNWLRLRLEGKDYEIAFERGWRSGQQNVEMKYDRLGRVSYTRVAVRFPYATHGSDIEELRRVSHKAINRVLDVYRAATKEFHVGHIPIHELGPFDVAHGTYDARFDGGNWELHSFRFDLGQGISNARLEPISHNAVLDLAYERPLSLVDVLVLNARQSLLLEEYRVAVVEAETAFEVGVDGIVRQHYLSKTTKSSAGDVVQVYSKESVDAILEAGLKNLIKDHIPEVMGMEFIGTEEHKRWEKDCYSLRNSVVHDGREIHAQEAERAVEAAEDALLWMGSMSPEEWPSDDRLNSGGHD